jgi:hypothetical protein
MNMMSNFLTQCVFVLLAFFAAGISASHGEQAYERALLRPTPLPLYGLGRSPQYPGYDPWFPRRYRTGGRAYHVRWRPYAG